MRIEKPFIDLIKDTFKVPENFNPVKDLRFQIWQKEMQEKLYGKKVLGHLAHPTEKAMDSTKVRGKHRLLRWSLLGTAAGVTIVAGVWAGHCIRHKVAVESQPKISHQEIPAKIVQKGDMQNTRQ